MTMNGNEDKRSPRSQIGNEVNLPCVKCGNVPRYSPKHVGATGLPRGACTCGHTVVGWWA